MAKESEEYGFMATLDGERLFVSDSNGGGTSYAVFTRDDALAAIERYIQRCAQMLAESIAEDLYDDGTSDEVGTEETSDG
jgi:hypothetical protein